MDFLSKSEQATLLAAKNIIVGYSGGADSTLALFATNEFLKAHDQASKLTALYVDHQIHVNSTVWLKHCEVFCGKHNIAFKCQKAEIKQSGQGFEAAARTARQIIFNTYDEKSVIILGHHMDDQVETVFFRVLRGTGLKGLSGIPRHTEINGKDLLRPLLHVGKAEILQFIDKAQLDFIEDESNQDNSYSRNFLRNKVIPLITERWPGAKKNTARMANLMSKQSKLYHQFLIDKLKSVCDDDGLLLDKLSTLDYFERAELIRIWLDQQSFASPNESQMKELEKSFFQSRQDANPKIKFYREDAQKTGVILSKTNNYLIAEELNE